MLDAAIKALSQMFSPSFRSILLKAIGLAIVLLIVIGIGLQRLLSFLVDTGGGMVTTSLGPMAQTPVNILEWILAIIVGLGIVVGAVFLMPAVTSLVAGFFSDTIADEVERVHYPGDPPGRPVPVGRAIAEGIKAALLAVVVYLCAVPLLLILGLGAIIFFLANAYVLGRVYFELEAMRFHPVDEAKRLRKLNSGMLFVAGLFIAAFVSIPIVNLATPLFGTAFMVHVYKRLVAGPVPVPQRSY